MSIFYLSPVKGDMPVHLLEKIVFERLEFFKAVYSEKPSVYNEYVVEGGIYDNVGHFTLCILAILCGERSFNEYILKAETELFMQRFLSLSSYDLRCFAKKVLQRLKKIEIFPSHFEPLQAMCHHLMLKHVTSHLCSDTHTKYCIDYNINLHFKHCLLMVARRQVELCKGIAQVPCGLWKKYICNLYANHLNKRIKNTNVNILRNDPRIMSLAERIKQEVIPRITSYTNNNILASRNIDKVSSYFPPCMLNLHQNLRKRHRLSHMQRFYYSLFLKDIGMPVEEAIVFWRDEYRKNPHGSHSCSHNWEKDEKKFLYGIRHMYGLEGRRKSYPSVNCFRIQSVESACSEGGCPYKSFENNSLYSFIQQGSESLTSQINELRNKRQYTAACVVYLKSVCVNTPCDNLSFNFTPVKYYTLMNNGCNGVNIKKSDETVSK